jgi:multidrug efflux pump subunit AcrA (membrane-fusion protein)
MYINPTLDSVDRSVKVQAEVQNVPAVLKGGMFIRGRILTGKHIQVLQAPRLALMDWNLQAGKAAVFLLSGGKVLRREVTTGAANGELVEITTGLAVGDLVVIRGGFNLKDGDDVTVRQ